MGLVDAIYGREPDRSSLRLVTVSSVEPLTVAYGSGTLAATSWLPGHAHVVGEPVVVMMTRDKAYIIGSADPRPQLGTMMTTSGSTVTVATDSGVVLRDLPVVGAPPAAGARVVLAWGASGCVVIGAVGTSPPPAPPTPPPGPDPDPSPSPPSGGRGSVSAMAVDVRTARGGSWRTDKGRLVAIQGRWGTSAQGDNIGYLFFGGACAVDGAVAQPGAGRVTLTRDSATGMGAAREIRIQMVSADRPGASPSPLLGVPSVIGSLPQGRTGTFPLPDWAAQGLLDRTYGGIALVHPGTTHYLAVLGASSPGDQQPQVTLPYTL